MRAHYRNVVQDTAGNLSNGASVSVYQPGTTTHITGPLYADGSSGTTLTNPFTSSDGSLSFYLASPQRVDVGVTPVAGQQVIFRDIDVTAPPADALDWVNVVSTFGADPAGVTASDSALASALAAGGLVYLPAGTYKLSGSAALAMSVAGTRLMGAGAGLTFLQISSGFTGPQAVAITANSCVIQDLAVVGASSTITSNPVANGVEITGAQHCQVHDVFFQYINGWALEVVGGSSNAALDLMVGRLIARNCAGGIHDKGVTGSSFGGEHFFTDIQMQQVGVGTGGSANLDTFMIEDCNDVLIENYNGAISDASTGSTLHIKGKCSTVKGTNLDIGCFPNGSGSNSVILIEDSANGSPSALDFVDGIVQQGMVGLTISGGAATVQFTSFRFSNNFTHGVVLSGSGSQVHFESCTWTGNGAGASGTNYELNASGTTTGQILFCHFRTAVVSTGTSGVQNVINLGSSGQAVEFHNNEFIGTGTTLSTTFNGNLPRRIRNCLGYNPHGSVTVTVPATGVATGALHYDAWFYITAGTGGCTIVRNTNGNGGGAGPTVTIPAAQCTPVFVPAMCTITPTFTNAPTWVVDGI